jgi:hypothetical protein
MHLPGGVEKARIDGLEIDQDLDFQRRSWVVQRIGWIFMTLFVLSAGVGLLGSGPLSHARAEAPGAMSVEYQRVARLETSETLTVRLEAAATAGTGVRLSLDRQFLDSARMASVLPPPTRVESAAGRLIYVFAVAEPGTPMVVTFNFEPQEIGRHRAIVGLESSPAPRSLTFHQLVYP